MRIAQYRMMFAPGSRPDPRTVRGWVADGDLYGVRLGGILYVDPERDPQGREPAPALNSPLARRVVNQ